MRRSLIQRLRFYGAFGGYYLLLDYRAAIAWIVWNQFLETYADYRFRVEDVNITQVCVLGNFGDRCSTSLESESAEKADEKSEEELMDDDEHLEETEGESTSQDRPTKNARSHVTYTLSDIKREDPWIASQIRMMGEK